MVWGGENGANWSEVHRTKGQGEDVCTGLRRRARPVLLVLGPSVLDRRYRRENVFEVSSGQCIRIYCAVSATRRAFEMKRATASALLLICFGASALPARAQRLNVDPAHPYSASEQKQAEQLYKKSLKEQEKAQKKAEKAQRKAWKKQQKQMAKDDQARQKQIEQAQHHH